MRSIEFLREAGPGEPMTDAEYAAQQFQGQKNLQSIKNWWNGAPQTGGTAVPTARDPATVRGQGAAAEPVVAEPTAAQPAPSFNVPGAAQDGQGGYNYTTGVEQDRPHRTDAGGDETTRNDYPFNPQATTPPGSRPKTKPFVKIPPKTIRQNATPAPAPAADYDYTDPMGTDDAASIMKVAGTAPKQAATPVANRPGSSPMGGHKSGQAPAAPAAQAATPAASSAIVKPGDTLSKIAAANRTTVQAIMAANPSIRDANKIAAGQSIRLPGAMAQSATPVANPPMKPGLGSSPMRESSFDDSVNSMRRLSNMLKG